MPTVLCSHEGCDAVFTKETQKSADQALRMHIGRKHEKRIIGMNNKNENIAIKHGNKDYQRCLSSAETATIVAFINERRTEFPTKLACFQAALEHVGATKRIVATSSTVTRYFDKADKHNSADVPAKRKYTRRQIQPEAREVRVNFCPNCGCNIHAVATGLAMAKIA